MIDILLVSKKEFDQKAIDNLISMLHNDIEMAKLCLATLCAVENGMTVKLSVNIKQGSIRSVEAQGQVS